MTAHSPMRARGTLRYRRRHRLPALALLVLLVAGAIFVWTRVFESAQDIEAATACPPPARSMPAAHTAGVPQKYDSLNRTDPVRPQEIDARILNANGQNKQATLIAEELTGFGIRKAEPGNDPLYPNYELKCHGQIRFGEAGTGAARTMSLIVPCAQLVRDDRQDASVDVALGSKFGDLTMTADAKQIIKQLRESPPPGQNGAAHPEGEASQVDSRRLNEARDVHC